MGRFVTGWGSSVTPARAAPRLRSSMRKKWSDGRACRPDRSPGLFEEPWSPRTVAVLNDYDIRVVKTKGEFTRHSHPETDEVFLVLSGSLTIRLDDGEVTLGSGQLYVVPRGVQSDGAEVVLIEPSATVNTGDTPNQLTAERRRG